MRDFFRTSRTFELSADVVILSVLVGGGGGLVTRAKTAQPIVSQFGAQTLLAPRNHVLDGEGHF